MMNIDIMRLLANEVECEAKSMDTVRAAADRWGCGPRTFGNWRLSANGVFAFQQDGACRFLRLAHTGDRRRDHIQAELDFVVYLAAQGVSAAQPIHSTAGLLVETVDSPYGEFYAVVFEQAPGSILEVAQMDDTLCQTWGQTLGELHVASEHFEPNPARRRRSWEDEIHNADAWLPAEDTGARRVLAQARAWLESLPRGPADYGLIHYDFELDNLPWDGERFRVIDFDDAAYYWFAADIAFALDDVMDESVERQRQIIAAFLDGYRAVRPLDARWERATPGFVKLMKVLKFARVIHAYRSADPALDPPGLEKMRARHHAWLDRMRRAFSDAGYWHHE